MKDPGTERVERTRAKALEQLVRDEAAACVTPRSDTLCHVANQTKQVDVA